MSATLAVQKALLARLRAAPALVALVPTGNMLDRNARPAVDPAINIGEGQAVDAGDIDRANLRVFLDLHLWRKETSTEGVKAIADAIRDAIREGRLALDAPFVCGDCRASMMRFLRDPDGESSHGILTIETLVGEA